MITVNGFANENPRPNDLGRLFFSPAERQQLNQQRFNPSPLPPEQPKIIEPLPEPEPVVEMPAPPPPVLPEQLQFNGVYHHEKHILIWINQQLAPWTGVKSVRYLPKQQAVFILLSDEQQVRLKLGETWQNQSLDETQP